MKPIWRNHGFWRPQTPAEIAKYEAMIADGNRECDRCGREHFAHGLACSIRPSRFGQPFLACYPDAIKEWES